MSDANVTKLSEFHDAWFQLILKGCADAEQDMLISRISSIQFGKSDNGMYCHTQIAPFIASVHALFDNIPNDQQSDIENSKEVRDAVYRQLPAPIRNLIQNRREDGQDDTWVTICDVSRRSLTKESKRRPF